MTTQQINISFSSAMADTIRIHTGETGRVIVFTPDILLEQDQSAEIIIVKPDNTFVIDNATIVNGLIKVTMPEQAGAVSGVGGYILKVYKDSLCVYSASGPLMVDDHLLTDGMIESVAEAHGYVFPDDFLTDDDIEINPTSPAFATLTKIKYKGVTYEVDGGAEDLDDLDDVEISAPSDGQLLKYNPSISKWTNTDDTSTSRLNAMKTGFDGVEYDSPAAMVQGCDNILSDKIGTESDNINVLKLRVNSYFPEFIVGGIDVNNGEFGPADVNRAHTDLISTKGCSIYVPVSWGVYLVYYSNDGEYAGSSGGWETGVVTPNTAYEAFRILIRSTDLVTDFTGIPNGGIIEVVNNDVNIKDDVDALKSKLNMNYCDIYPNAINVSNGRVEPNNNTRAITGFIPYKYNFIYANSGYSYYIVCYNADLSHKSATGWKTGNAAVPSCAFYRLLIKNDSISDWTGIRNNFISIYNSETVTFRNKIIIGTDGYYTSFSEGIIAAFNLGNCDVYVNKGTYNIKTEMESLYGANVWSSDYSSNPYKRGLPWGNGMRIIGSPGVVLQMDASGISNTDVWAEFSVLMNYSGAADDQKVNSVEGIKFNCTCIRYCIHLDLGAYEMDDTYIMDSCSFYLDNSENTTKTFAYCVGMGASINTTYKITNCYVYGITPPNPRDTAYLYFHHTNATSPNDKMIFEGNYIDNGGTIRIDEYGDSQNKCLVLVSNNSLGSALIPPKNPTDNLKVCAWNNEVRTA